MSKKNTYKKYIEKNGRIIAKVVETPAPEEMYKEENAPEYALENVDEAIEELKKEEPKQYVRVTKGNWFIRIGPGKGYAHIAIAHGQDEFEYTGKILARYYEILYKDKKMYIATECGEVIEK